MYVVCFALGSDLPIDLSYLLNIRSSSRISLIMMMRMRMTMKSATTTTPSVRWFKKQTWDQKYVRLIVGNYFLQQGQSDGDKRRAPRRFEAATMGIVGARAKYDKAMLQLDAQPNVGGPHVHQVLELHQRYK